VREEKREAVKYGGGGGDFLLSPLCINYQLDAQIIIYSYNITFLYMFRAIDAHLQEVILYTCSIWYRHSLRAVHRLSPHSVFVPIGHHDRS
jgi:hypothetical protein